MGVHGASNMQKKRNLYMSKHKVTALKRKNRRRNRRVPQGQIELLDAQLMSRQQLQKRLSNPTANIALSGKKRNKLLKALRHTIKSKQQDEEESSDGELDSDDQFDPDEKDGELSVALDQPTKSTADDIMEVDQSTEASTSGAPPKRSSERIKKSAVAQ